MTSLQEVLTAPSTAPKVVDACCQLVEAEVAAKRGISGVAVKASYKVVRKVKPTMVQDVVRKLLPAFAQSLDPIYQDVREAPNGPGPAFRGALERDPDKAANALLAVTDRRIEGAQPVVSKAYSKLRKGALEHVREAMPGLGKCLEPYL